MYLIVGYEICCAIGCFLVSIEYRYDCRNYSDALKSCVPNSYLMHQPSGPYFLRSMMVEWMNAIAYISGSQYDGLSTESSISCVSYVYVRFRPALMPDGRSFVSLMHFWRRPIGNFA